MIVVFPIHGGDALQAIHHAAWMEKMAAGRPKYGEALITHDTSINRDVVQAFKAALSATFERVSSFQYPRPQDGGWPMAPNWAWQHTARQMMDRDYWLWMEADAIALRPDWVQRIDTEYLNGAMPFMGPKVKGMAHVNGVAVYARNTPEMLPQAMRSTSMAWDYEAGPEMMHRTHDASHLMQHVWSVDAGRWLECGGGQVPMLVTAEELRANLLASAVLVHRIKDNSVLNMLLMGEVIL